MSIDLDVLGRAYKIPEPVGEAALDLYGDAMAAMEARGAMDALTQAATAPAAEAERLSVRAARLLSACSEGRAVVRRTLVGAEVDGEAITASTYAALYAQPGRQMEPYIVALTAWSRLGFFSVATGSERPPTAQEARPSGAV